MCATFLDTVSEELFQEYFEVPWAGEWPRTVQFPGYEVRVVANSKEGERKSRLMRWGLIPTWAKEPKQIRSTFNARADSIREKPSFRTAFERRRCLLVGSAYYEWTGEKGSKLPVRFETDQPLAFAGIWEIWGQGEERIVSCSMVTTEPNSVASEYHDRMPVLLAPADWSVWLDKLSPASDLLALLAPQEIPGLRSTVTTKEELV
jgi:putative SOS response-associated peptidase YedK